MKKIIINLLIVVVSMVVVGCSREKNKSIVTENIATSSLVETSSDATAMNSLNLNETRYRLKKINDKYARFHDMRFADNNLYLAGNEFNNDFSEELVSVIDIQTDTAVPVCKYEVGSDVYLYDNFYNIYITDEGVCIDKTDLQSSMTENVFCDELNMDVQYFYVCGTRKYICGFDGNNRVINVYDADYECVKTLLFSKDEIAKNICCDSAGNTYVFLYRENNNENVLYKYDNQFNECYSNSYSDMSGFPTCAFKEENSDNLVIVTYDNEKIFINTIDSHNGKTIERYEYMSDDLQGIFPGAMGYEMIFITADGVYGYNYSLGELEMIYKHDIEKTPIGITEDGKFVVSQIVENTFKEESDGLIKTDGYGNIIDKMSYIKNQNGFVSQAYITKKGGVYYIEEKYNPMYIEDNAQAIHIVHYMDFSGDHSYYEVPAESMENYPLFIVANSEKKTLIAETNDGEMILNIYDSSGVLIKKINKPGFCGLNLYFMCEDKLYIGMSENGEENNFYSFDFNDSKLTLIEEIPEGGSGCTGENINEIYLYSSDGINKYSFESKELSTVVNQVEFENDVSVNKNVVDMTFIGNDEFVVSLYTEGDGFQCYRVEKFQTESVPTLTIGAFCFDRDMLGYITKFNEENQDCRIVTKSYDSDEFINEMHMDLIQNKLDIIISDVALSINDYDKDMFCDLSDFFENDENIVVSDYYENIIGLYKEEGVMHRISPSFTVSALLGRAEDIEQNKNFGWNVKQFLEYASKYNVIGESERSIVMRKFIPYFADNFIDSQNYTCDFVNTDFKSIMSIIKEKVENLEYGGYVSTSELLDKTVDLVMTDINLGANSYSIFNDMDIVFKGYPSENKNGFIVNPGICFSITSNCEDKEVAWRFIRYFLLDEYQSGIKNGIPLKKSYKDNLFVDVTQTYYGVIDEKVSSEIKKKVIEVIENADILNRVEISDRVYKIIEEETNLYFDDQIDVDEMAQSVQSKISLYLSEIK